MDSKGLARRSISCVVGDGALVFLTPVQSLFTPTTWLRRQISLRSTHTEEGPVNQLEASHITAVMRVARRVTLFIAPQVLVYSSLYSATTLDSAVSRTNRTPTPLSSSIRLK